MNFILKFNFFFFFFAGGGEEREVGEGGEGEKILGSLHTQC